MDGGIGNTKRLIENLSDKERVGTAEAAVRFLNKAWREDVQKRSRDGPGTKRSKYEALDCDYSQQPLLRYKKLPVANLRSTSPPRAALTPCPPTSPPPLAGGRRRPLPLEALHARVPRHEPQEVHAQKLAEVRPTHSLPAKNHTAA